MTEINHAAQMATHYIEQAFNQVQSACESVSGISREQERPFMLLKPKMFPDGNMWCALYGENLQEGVAAFGETPAKAAIQFDIEWLNQKSLQDKIPARKIKSLVGLDLDAIRKEEDQIILRQARYKGYKAENLGDSASEEERAAWNEGFNARGK